MKSIFKIFLLILIISPFGSCGDDCGECFSPPNAFVFAILDKDTGENVFTSGRYSSNEIMVLNSSTNQNTEFRFIDANDFNLIEINSIGWETEVVSLDVKVGGDVLFKFTVDAERKSEDCCSFTVYNSVVFNTTDIEFENGVHKIFID